MVVSGATRRSSCQFATTTSTAKIARRCLLSSLEVWVKSVVMVESLYVRPTRVVKARRRKNSGRQDPVACIYKPNAGLVFEFLALSIELYSNLRASGPLMR